MKATEQYFHEVLFTLLYTVVLTFESVDEALTGVLQFKRKLLNSTFMRCCSAWVYFSVQGGSNFWVCRWSLNWRVTIQTKAIDEYFHVMLLIMLYKMVLTFKSVDEALTSMLPFKWKLLSSASNKVLFIM